MSLCPSGSPTLPLPDLPVKKQALWHERPLPRAWPGPATQARRMLIAVIISGLYGLDLQALVLFL